MASGILIVASKFTTAREDEVRDWFSSEHLPDRRSLRECGRWIGINDSHLAVASFELDDGRGATLSNPDSAAPVISRWQIVLRFEGELVGSHESQPPDNAGGLLINAMSVEPEYENEFNAWYDTEHIPALSAVPGTLSARRFRSSEGTPRYLAMYHLAWPDVQLSPDWKQAANTPWTERMRPQFRDHVRIVAKPYTRTPA